MNYKKIIIWELIGFVFFFAIRNLFLGTSFLMTVISLLFLFAAVFTGCFVPFGNKLILKICSVLKIVMLLCLVFGLVSFCIVEYMIAVNSADDQDAESEFAVVLGAGVYGTVPSATLVSRLEKAYEYMTAYPASKVVLSGGQGKNEDISEAQAMKKYLVEKGIDPNRLYLEDKSSSTAENLLYSSGVIENLTGQKPVNITIISNNFHLFRAKLLAQNIDINAKAVGAPVPKIGLVPLSCWVREYFSVMFMHAKNLTGVYF